MTKFITLSEAARVMGKSPVTLREYAAEGRILGAVKLNDRTWMVPRRYAYGYGRGPEEEQAEPRTISTDGERDIVLAKNEDGRFGIYIDEEWYGAGEALEILAYLQQHQQWLHEGREANRKQENLLNINNIPMDQRPSEKTWKAIEELVEQGRARLSYEDGVYSITFTSPDDNETIPLSDAVYSNAIGLYNKQRFPRL